VLNFSKGYFFDLDIDAPFTGEDIFSDEDWDFILNTKHTPEKKIEWTNTKNLSWLLTPFSFIGDIGWIHSTKFKRKIREYCNDTFAVDILSEPAKTGFGKVLFPASVLRFANDANWHMEGIADYMNLSEHLYSFFKDYRLGYCINFKLFGSDSTSHTEFGEPDEQTILCENENIDYLNKQRKEDYPVYGFDPQALIHLDGEPIYTTNLTRSGFNSALEGEKHVTLKAKREGYKSPYAINLAKYHRVLMDDDQPRVTLRLHCSTSKLSFENLEKLHFEGKLLKN